MGLEREPRSPPSAPAVQLTAVGAIVALAFEHAGLGLGLRRGDARRRVAHLRPPHARHPARHGARRRRDRGRRRDALVPLLATGAFDTRPRELIPSPGS